METEILKTSKHRVLGKQPDQIEGKHIHIQMYAGKIYCIKVSNSCEQEIVDEITDAYISNLLQKDERTFTNRLIKALVKIQHKYNFSVVLDYSQILDFESENVSEVLK